MGLRLSAVVVLLGMICTLFLAFAPGAHTAAPPTTDSPFGFLTSFFPQKRPPPEEMEARRRSMDLPRTPADVPPYSTALELGVRWERPTSPIIDWGLVQRDRGAVVSGKYDWTIPDRFLAPVPRDLNLVVTITVGDRPLEPGTWKFRAPQARENFLAFVRKTVERYDGDGVDDMPGLKNPVRFWQIENEPEARTPRPPQDKPKPNTDWEGFAEIVQLATAAIRAADPGARVLCAGTFSPPAPARERLWQNFWLPLIGKLNGKGPDIFDLHWFDANYRDSYPAYKRFREALDQNGFRGAEIWITETGSSSREGELHQAIDLVKRFVYPLGYGVKRVFWAWALVEGWPPFTCESIFDYTGLIYDGNCPGDPGYGIRKLGYHTYALMTRKLAGADFSSIATLSSGENDVFVYRLTRPGGDVHVVWRDGAEKANAGTYTLAGVADGAYLVTEAVPAAAEGKEIAAFSESIFASKQVQASGGALRLDLSSRPVYVERAPSR
jgi:hypothetical protein